MPDGEIQHWLGLAFLEKSTLDKMSAILLNFNEYHHMIPLQIIESKAHEARRRPVRRVFAALQETSKRGRIECEREREIHAAWIRSRAVIACRSTHIGEAEHPRNKKT